MNVLDTNVLSELMRRQPHERVLAYVDHLEPHDTFITAVTMAEIRYGVARLPDGRRRSELALRADVLFTRTFDGRVLSFGSGCTGRYAEICAARDAAGRPITTADAMIAAICRHHRARLVTRNMKDFERTGVAVVDPWSAEQGPGG